MFLAAPRSTGKSTFVREDLRPAFARASAFVGYADLWGSPTADPGEVIVATIRAALASKGSSKGVSLTDSMVALSDEIKQVIVLIIDEAQHAITTDASVAALFALKAARNELNSTHHHDLRVVCTGSNRDKLAMLRNSKDQAFYGAPMVSFPTLGKDFIEWFCQKAE